jgi:hypothetical protein
MKSTEIDLGNNIVNIYREKSLFNIQKYGEIQAGRQTITRFVKNNANNSDFGRLDYLKRS